MAVRNFFRLDDQHPFTGWHMLAVVCLFFGVIISVNLMMAFVATGTFPGLVVKNSYVASQNYNELLRQSREQASSGLKLDLGYDDGVVLVRFTGKDGAAVRDLGVSALVGRPESAADDRRIELVAEAGSYRLPDRLPAGNWLIEIEAYRGDALVFRQQQQIYVRP